MKKFIEISEDVAKQSKESTKIGCILLHHVSNKIECQSYNYKINDQLIHAEKALICKCAEVGIYTKHKILILNYYPPCFECAELIMLAKISQVIYNCPKLPERWVEKCEKGIILLKEHKIEVINYAEIGK